MINCVGKADECPRYAKEIRKKIGAKCPQVLQKIGAKCIHYIPVRCAPVLAVLAVMHISCLLPDYCSWVCNCYCPCLTILVSIVLVLVFCLKLSLFLLEKLSGYSIVWSSLFCCVLYLTKSLIFCHFFKTMRDIYRMWKRWRSGAVLLSLLTERNISWDDKKVQNRHSKWKR